mgnify:CR=1 FL=1
MTHKPGKTTSLKDATPPPISLDQARRQRPKEGSHGDNRSADTALRALAERTGPIHLRLRLGLEEEKERQLFGQGRNFFHIENWSLLGTLLKFSLNLSKMDQRGRDNARDIQLKHNTVRLKNLPPAFDGYTLLHISDSHLDMAEDIPAALIRATREVEYDACVWTGDFRGATHGDFEPALRGLEKVRAHLKEPVYAILGNHDTIRMVPAMEALGIRVLLNEHVALERDGERIFLAGIDDPHFYRADNLEKAADEIPQEAVSILLSHSPEIYKFAALANLDLLLCGHTHGGQICLPGGQPLIINANCPRYMGAGAWQYLQLQGYTSAGSGACVMDVRFNCPPEVTLHTLQRQV